MNIGLIGSNQFRQARASGLSAGAAIDARKQPGYLFHPGIGFNMKFFRSPGKQHPERKSQTG